MKTIAGRNFVILASALLFTFSFAFSQNSAKKLERPTTLLEKLALATDQRELMKLNGELGKYYQSKELSRSQEYFQKALGLAKELGSDSDKWVYQRHIALVESFMGNPKKSLELCDEYLGEIKASGDSILIYYYYSIGLAHQALMSYDDAQRFYMKVSALGDSLGEHRLSTAVIGLIAKVYKQQ
ncbi:MAG: hypothetical protein AAF696_22290 [Bacteroidota bacterium]